MPEKLVTIATYSYAEEAHLSRAKLQSEGIASFVANEYTGAANWHYPAPFGSGVKLQVKESDAEEALRVLRSAQEPSAEVSEYEGQACPVCHSPDIHRERSRWRAIGSWFFAFPLFKEKWKCRNCGHEWIR